MQRYRKAIGAGVVSAGAVLLAYYQGGVLDTQTLEAAVGSVVVGVVGAAVTYYLRNDG